MATLQASTASNWPRVDPDAIEEIKAIIDDYDFFGNFDDLTVAVEESADDEPYLAVYGYAAFDAIKPITDEDGNVVDHDYDHAEEFLTQLAPHLDEPLVVETVGFEKCRFPLLASQWTVWPDGTIAYDALDHSPEKSAAIGPDPDPGTDGDGADIVNWPAIQESVALALDAECPDAKAAVIETVEDALGNHAADLELTTSAGEDNNEAVTETESALADALRDLLAIERDRELGYPRSELHTGPLDAIRKGRDALEAAGVGATQFIGPEYEEKLGL